MRYHDVKLKALVHLAAVDAAFVLLAVLALLFPQQASAVMHAWRPRTPLGGVELAAALAGLALMIAVIGVWMASLTPHQEVVMIQKRKAKGKAVGTPHPSLFDESDPDHHISTFAYLRKTLRAS